MAGTVDIVNRALTKLGDERISSLSDGTKAAAVASSLYEMVRDRELAAHSWNFAKARKKLAALADKPAFGWDWQYLLPADYLRLLEAGPWPQADMSGYVGGDHRPSVVEGQHILAHQGPVMNLVYLRKVEDPGLFPPIFIEALACKLAVEMAESLAGSNSKRQLAWDEYQMAVAEAKRINAIGLPPVTVQDDTWMVAHQMGVI